MLSKFVCLLSAIVVTSCTIVYSQSLVGVEANQIISGAKTIRLGEVSKVPEYVEFDKGKEIPYSKFLSLFQHTFHWSPQVNFKLLSKERDQIGMVHYRLVQTFDGQKVEGTMCIVHTKNDLVQSFSGQIFDQISAPNQVVISEKIALALALQHVNAERYRWDSPLHEKNLQETSGNPLATWFPQGELVLVAEKGNFKKENLRLAYKFDIYAEIPLRRNFVFVDAANGKIIHEQNRIMDVNTPATAITAYSGSRNIMTDSFNGAYRLRESGRGFRNRNLQYVNRHQLWSCG
jgi:bacillolysin